MDKRKRGKGLHHDFLNVRSSRQSNNQVKKQKMVKVIKRVKDLLTQEVALYVYAIVGTGFLMYLMVVLLLNQIFEVIWRVNTH